MNKRIKNKLLKKIRICGEHSQFDSGLFLIWDRETENFFWKIAGMLTANGTTEQEVYDVFIEGTKIREKRVAESRKQFNSTN